MCVSLCINAHLTSQSVLQGSVTATGRGKCSQRWSDTSRWSLLRTHTAFRLRSPAHTRKTKSRVQIRQHLADRSLAKISHFFIFNKSDQLSDIQSFIIQPYGSMSVSDPTNTSIYWIRCALWPTGSLTRLFLKQKFEGLRRVKGQAKGKVSGDVIGRGHTGVAGRGVYRNRGWVQRCIQRCVSDAKIHIHVIWFHVIKTHYGSYKFHTFYRFVGGIYFRFTLRVAMKCACQLDHKPLQQYTFVHNHNFLNNYGPKFTLNMYLYVYYKRIDPVIHVWRFGSQAEILPWQMRVHSSQEPEGSHTNCSLCSSMGMLKE